jgi:hypothetical protein
MKIFTKPSAANPAALVLTTFKMLGVFALLLVLTAGSSRAGTIDVLNNSFESPAYGNGGYQYLGGLVDSWTYGGGSGVANENSPWFAGTPPDGNQAAFCQQTSCSISQTISGFTVGDSYTVSFYEAGRPGYSAEPIEVMLGGVDLGTFTPGSLSFNEVTTGPMDANNTTMTLEFLGGNSSGNDWDTALDLVTIQSVSSVPEPSSVTLLLTALLAVGFVERKRIARSLSPPLG